ncbi:Uncharacterized protein DAT39_010993 [Clarias magur]|uniref:Uncharacterized protein n=1 Tax=Clarias magur TaxID=1594786 RepID=A0A8J4U3Z2_CLAMG|nr:Uncharacterized protein DAT39_010993 [Clarias magur]
MPPTGSSSGVFVINLTEYFSSDPRVFRSGIPTAAQLHLFISSHQTRDAETQGSFLFTISTRGSLPSVAEQRDVYAGLGRDAGLTVAAGCDSPCHTMSHFFHSITAKQTERRCWTQGRPRPTGCAAVGCRDDVCVVFPSEEKDLLREYCEGKEEPDEGDPFPDLTLSPDLGEHTDCGIKSTNTMCKGIWRCIQVRCKKLFGADNRSHEPLRDRYRMSARLITGHGVCETLTRTEASGRPSLRHIPDEGQPHSTRGLKCVGRAEGFRTVRMVGVIREAKDPASEGMQHLPLI